MTKILTISRDDNLIFLRHTFTLFVQSSLIDGLTSHSEGSRNICRRFKLQKLGYATA